MFLIQPVASDLLGAYLLFIISILVIQKKSKSRLILNETIGQYLIWLVGKSIKKTLENRTPIIEYNKSTPNIIKRKLNDLTEDFSNIKKEKTEVDPFTKKTNEAKTVSKK